MRTATPTEREVAFDRARGRIFLEKADLPLADAGLRSLRTSEDAALGIDAALLREASRAFAIPASTSIVRCAEQGTFHRLYDVAETGKPRRLLRVAALPGAGFADLMALECLAMGALRRTGLAIPACEFREVSSGAEARGAHLVDRAPGASLTTLEGDEARMVESLGWAAQFLAKLHRHRGEGFGPVSLARLREGDAAAQASFAGIHRRWRDYIMLRLHDHLRACQAGGCVSAREASDIAGRFERHAPLLDPAASAILHGDPGSHNFMVDPSGLRAVIDWEDALLGDPLFDLASFCTFHPERRHEAMWSAYGANLDGTAWTRFWLYFLRIALAKTVHRQRFGYTDMPGRAPAAQRIQLALRRLDEAR